MKEKAKAVFSEAKSKIKLVNVKVKSFIKALNTLSLILDLLLNGE